MIKSNKTYAVKILSNDRIAPGVSLLSIDLPNVPPFSFYKIVVPSRDDLLLRRPFAVFTINDISYLIIAEVGEGTHAILSQPVGSYLSISGPFGSTESTYQLDDYDKVLVIGGGIGIAGVLQYAAMYPTNIAGIAFGSPTKWDNSFYSLLNSIPFSSEVIIATDDGTTGERGFVTDATKSRINNNEIDAIIACGPTPMLRSTVKLANDFDVPCFVSLEARMACGVGACRGCAVPVHPELAGGKEYLMVCSDGPLFDAKIIDWERLR